MFAEHVHQTLSSTGIPVTMDINHGVGLPPIIVYTYESIPYVVDDAECGMDATVFVWLLADRDIERLRRLVMDTMRDAGFARMHETREALNAPKLHQAQLAYTKYFEEG